MCPCGSGAEEADCCGKLIAGAPAPTALALMRSRYTAYVRGAIDYLIETHPGSSRDREAIARFARESRFVRLEILATERGGPDDDEGVVEFIAHAEKFQLRERSLFRRLDGKWRYISAEKTKPAVSEKKPGRNDPCPCGSGKKYKKCHG